MCPSSPLVKQRSFDCEIQIDRRSSTSLAIPLPASHIHRTESETQLDENMAVAEYRDRCMFNRLISGIRYRQQLHYHFQSHNNSPQQQQCPPDSEPASRFSRGMSSFRRFPRHVPHPIQDTAERTIENIISTRCNPIESDEVTVSNISDDSSEESHFLGTTVQNNITTNAILDDADDDWAIEGFEESPNCPRNSEDDYDVNHHVFHMDL